MLRKLRRRRPSHTTVVAYLALFFAVGGAGAYAANEWTGANIKDGTLDSRDLRNNSAVRSPDVRNDDQRGGGLVGRDIRNNTLTGADVRALTGADVNDDSLGGNDINESTLEGVRVGGLERVQGLGVEDSTSPKFTRAFCPPGKKVVGTGARILGGTTTFYPNTTGNVIINNIWPDSGLDYVQAEAHENEATSDSWRVDVYAICANAY